MDPADRKKYNLPPQEKHQQAKVRHVIFHNQKGVFMGLDVVGNLRWSREVKLLPEATAPTFLNWQELKALLGEEKFNKDVPPKAMLNEVWPSGPGHRATAGDLRNANVPTWA